MAFDLEELQLAFQLHVIDLVVQDDAVTSDAEAAFLARMFPEAVLHTRGFFDEGGRTERFQEAAVQALDVLPQVLTEAQKHELLERCFEAAMVDDELRLGEASVVLMASRLLGIPDQAFEAMLGKHRQADGLSVALLDRDEE